MRQFVLPDLGEGLEEAEIVNWYVNEGDHVVTDQPLVSVETDKAVVEGPSPSSGRILHLFGAKGDVVNAMPQDTGPMAMLYRKDIFDRQGITPPTTWAEFADAAKKIHAADPNVFITDALFSSGDWVNALLWPMGWKPVSRDGDKLVININDKISKDFAAYWQDLITAGVIETKPGFNNEWYTGLDSGRYATWLTAGWGPVFLTSFAKTSAGK